MPNFSVTIFSAGSFRSALTELIDKLNNTGLCIHTEFGPAGLLRERIEQGEKCDIFISADVKNVERLSLHKAILAEATIAKNKLAITTWNKQEYRIHSGLELLLDPTLRVGTSTPECDPSGDYTWQLFELIEQAYPTQGERLKREAKQLVGGRQPAQIPQGKLASCYLLEQDEADLFVGYAHYRQKLLAMPDFIQKSLPPEFNVCAQYRCALLSPNFAAYQFYQQLISPQAQSIIQQHGFEHP